MALFETDLDLYTYGNDPESGNVAIWVIATCCGRFKEPGWPETWSCTDRLILESSTLFTRSVAEGLVGELWNKRQLALDLYPLRFESEALRHDSIELLGEPVRATLSLDKSERLVVEAHLNAYQTFIDLGLQVFQRNLADGHISEHPDFRRWHLACILSEDLRQELQVRFGKAVSESTDYEMDAHLAPRGEYVLVAPILPRMRDQIVRALLNPHALFAKKQIAIILGQESAYQNEDGSGDDKYVPARMETVNSLISDAKISPAKGTRFSSHQITQVLIPLATKRPSWKGRYHDLVNELRKLGIVVPNDPLVEFA